MGSGWGLGEGAGVLGLAPIAEAVRAAGGGAVHDLELMLRVVGLGRHCGAALSRVDRHAV